MLHSCVIHFRLKIMLLCQVLSVTIHFDNHHVNLCPVLYLHCVALLDMISVHNAVNSLASLAAYCRVFTLVVPSVVLHSFLDHVR